MKKIIITGLCGRVGAALVQGLKDKYEIFEINRSGQENNHYFLADVADFRRIKRVFKTIGAVEAVIHLAGDPRVEADWESVLKNNIEGTRNVFEATRLTRTKRIIFASSNHVTGAYEGLPPKLHLKKNPKMIKISDPIRPDSLYAVSKAFGEALGRMYHELYKMKVICIRIGSVNAEDKPDDERRLKTWLSHKDLVQLVKRALETNTGFGIYYGVSNNKGGFWDISNAREELGYKPESDAAKGE